jgi:hypothetical protein
MVSVPGFSSGKTDAIRVSSAAFAAVEVAATVWVP